MEQGKPLREERRKANSTKLEVNLVDPIIEVVFCPINIFTVISLLVSLGQLILGVNCHAGEAAKALWWDDDQGPGFLPSRLAKGHTWRAYYLTFLTP